MSFVRQMRVSKRNDRVLMVSLVLIVAVQHFNLTLSAISRISSYSSLGIGRLQSMPLTSQANVGCNGMTSKPNLDDLNGGGISPSIGRGVHSGVGVMVIILPALVVVVVAVAIVLGSYMGLRTVSVS
jgi:hypothetical protein